jgi:hypothetical protein
VEIEQYQIVISNWLAVLEEFGGNVGRNKIIKISARESLVSYYSYMFKQHKAQVDDEYSKLVAQWKQAKSQFVDISGPIEEKN